MTVNETASARIAPTEAWVSMRHLQRTLVFLRTAGLDVDDLLRQAGLTQDQIADGDAIVPLAVVEVLLAVFQDRHPDPFLGLHMAESVQPATLGALGFVLQACGTLGDLLDVAVRFNGLMSNFGHTSFTRSPGTVEVRWDCRAGGPLLRRHAAEYILGIFSVLTRLLVPGVPEPISVQFSHARPAEAGVGCMYFDFFGCPVYFEQPHSSITVPSSMLLLRLPHGDAVLKDMLERHASRLLERRKRVPSFPEDVRRLLKALLLAGTPTKDALAIQMGTSARTLHRHLDNAGTSYREQLDQVRMELACEALLGVQAPVSQLSEQLGFSAPQAFMRWFRQRAGVTPGQYRAAKAVATGEGGEAASVPQPSSGSTDPRDDGNMKESLRG